VLLFGRKHFNYSCIVSNQFSYLTLIIIFTYYLKKIETYIYHKYDIKMAIRIYDGYDFEGDIVVESDELLLGEAKNFAMDHGCTVMIRTSMGWIFKKGPTRASLGKNKPEGLTKCSGKSVYII